MDITTARERLDDWWEVEALYDTCFAPGRTALSSYRLRDGVDPIDRLCIVARDGDGQIAGAIRNWPVRVAASYTHLRAQETGRKLVCRLLLEKKKQIMLTIHFSFTMLLIQ